MTVFHTKSGIVVYGDESGAKMTPSGPGMFGWRVACWDAGNGRWHGFLWLHNLERVE